jgi:hypothetical protein
MDYAKAMNSLLLACVILGLYAACTAGFTFIRNRSVRPLPTPTTPAWRFPRATLLLAVTVALPTTLQFFFPGAGNSVGNFSLAASVAVACLAPHAARITRMTALLALSADGVLVLLKDIHGAAAVAGITLALVTEGYRYPRSTGSGSQSR